MILISGIFDLLSFEKEVPEQFISELYIPYPLKDKENWSDPSKCDLSASPKTRFLFYHSTKDPYVEVSQSKNFANKLSLNQHTVKTVFPDQGDHYYAVRDNYQESNLGEHVIDFILN